MLVPYYGFAATVLDDATHVLDFGCGDGTGAALLARAGRQLTCIDADPAALEAASLRVPSAVQRVVASDVPKDLHGAFDAAVVIDVLGHTPSPERVLASVRRGLRDHGRIVVADAFAHAFQALRPTARRSFTTPQVQRLLEAAGFKPVFVVDRPEGVVCLVAEKVEAPGVDAIHASMRAYERNDLKAVEASLHEACGVGDGAVRAAAWFALAELRVALRDGDGAVAALLRAAEDGQDPRPLAVLARLLVDAGDRDEARRFAVRAFEMDRLDPEAALAMAVVAEAVEDPGAGRFWRAAARLAPADAATVSGYASFCSSTGDHDDAIRALELLRSYGDDLGTEYHMMSALVLERAGRRDDALLEARLARRLAPKDPGVSDMVRRLACAPP